MKPPHILRRWNKIYKTLPHGTPLIVGVSGGADSLALLHALWSYRAQLPCTLHVATLDHGLRGTAGAEDAAFVVAMCRSWGIPVTAGKADAAATGGAGIEEAARQSRYAFLAGVARSQNATHVATAHNADDQAETVLMHVLRGSGLPGLAGMSESASLPGAPDLTLIRPLLDVSRAEIDDYLREHGLKPREDATNRDPIFLRNRLRLEIMPRLREINPQLTRALGQLADIAAADNAYLEEALHESIRDAVRQDDEAVELRLDVFRALHPALQRRFIAWAAAELSEKRDPANYTQVIAGVEAANRGTVGARTTLAGGLQVRVDYESLAVERVGREKRPDDLCLLPEEAEIAVALPGVTETPGGWVFLATSDARPAAAVLEIPEGARAVLRTRRAGERFAPLGMGGHTTKLKEWMIDRKIPRAVRDRLALLVVDGAIAAILTGESWAISERFAVRGGDGPRFYLSCRPKRTEDSQG